jgi:AmiR/NasT family two-component response regulator
MPRVLIAVSNGLLAKYFIAIVESVGYSDCGVAVTSEEAVALAANVRPDLVLMEDYLPGRQDGIAAAHEMKLQRTVAVILVTDDQVPAVSKRLQGADADAVLVKPVGARDLWDTLQRHCA